VWRYTLRTPGTNLTLYEADDSQLTTITSIPSKESTRPTWSASAIEVSAPRNRHRGLEAVSNIMTNEELISFETQYFQILKKEGAAEKDEDLLHLKSLLSHIKFL